ncbi:manganese-dependent inorganic pyrophosphatase [Oceanivirga miroungae]|uniref:inorganic diphosphatase n=1 Tax=Oceanivirga miroungae TaxID=1130046 RepID=A0A6I8MCA4_9FUSO|nr:manganese-dependent inorganic pyrophosphatase [Oceanivirga miroungae]VWL85091.1 inorganic diphosphatase [Oceanivirga miroungae]
MEEILVYGHRNPDSDAICTSIAYANLRNILKNNERAVAVRIGELNEETKYALEYFGVDNIPYVDNVAGKKIIMIDHNERTQTANGFEEAKVLELIDHHRIANFVTAEPLKARVEPYGCTSTIVCEMYMEKNIVPSKKMAGMMLSAIISDTLLFKSPTCTQNDIKACEYLASIAEVDLNKYGMDMLKAGTNLSKKTLKEILNMDMKIFELAKGRFGIAQINTVNEKEPLEKKEEYLKEISAMIEELKLDGFMFVITNILTNNSVAIVSGEKVDVIEKAFSKSNDSIIELPGVVSRKKQIVPPLTNA